MNHKTTPNPNHFKQQSLKPIGDYVGNVLSDTRKNILRQMLSQKSKVELIDALFEVVYLSDLLDYFKDDMDHFLAKC